MKKYVLLGIYNPDKSPHKIKIIYVSNDITELQEVWKTIEDFYLEIENTFDGVRGDLKVPYSSWFEDVSSLIHFLPELNFF